MVNGTGPKIKFKPYRYGHKLEAIDISNRIDAGELTEEADVKWVTEMVAEWDMKDAETSQPIPVGEYKLLTVQQVAQVQKAWQAYQREVWGEVKKTRNGETENDEE